LEKLWQQQHELIQNASGLFSYWITLLTNPLVIYWKHFSFANINNIDDEHWEALLEMARQNFLIFCVVADEIVDANNLISPRRLCGEQRWCQKQFEALCHWDDSSFFVEISLNWQLTRSCCNKRQNFYVRNLQRNFFILQHFMSLKQFEDVKKTIFNHTTQKDCWCFNDEQIKTNFRVEHNTKTSWVLSSKAWIQQTRFWLNVDCVA
jgi:hypothetical protein